MTPEEMAKTEFSLAKIRELTSARIGIGRTGGSLKTAEILDFDLAHARARDAVGADFIATEFMTRLQSALKATCPKLSWLTLQSAASDKPTYLKRPDYGRRLHESSVHELNNHQKHDDLIIIISDGLSARAAQSHSIAVLRSWMPMLYASQIKIGPIMVVPYARVGIVDPIGQILRPKSALILLGERPGLATPESLGAYFTYNPQTGRTDADRNCISNIHSSGIGPEQVALQLHSLLTLSLREKMGGVKLSELMAEGSASTRLE